MNSQTSPLLLDTHYWIWLQFGTKERLTSSNLEMIQKSAANGDLLISAISVWELGMLESKGRIHLGTNCTQWVEDALATPGLTLVPLTPEIALASTRLPGTLHADPADRIIAATARTMNARLLTSDQKLRAYGRKQHLQLA